MEFSMKHWQVLTCSNLPTRFQAMLLFFNKSESLGCAKVDVLKLDVILFYSGIHFKPLKLCKKSQRSELAHSTKDKRICLVGTCWKVPQVIGSIKNCFTYSHNTHKTARTSL